MAAARPRPQPKPTSATVTTTGSALPAPGAENAFYIVDLSGYVFRAYHAVAPLSSSRGEPTHAVFGTTQMLKRLIDDRRPAHLAIAMDSKSPSFRVEIDPRYKANRPAPPPDLDSQMRRCEQIARAYQIPIYQREGVEADDLIASLVYRARREAEALQIVIVSSDKDLMQLVDERLVLWDTMRDNVFGPAEVAAKWGVTPVQIRDLLALMGDSSDNIPGVPSVGPKTAADLVRQFGSLDEMYRRIDEVPKAKLKEALLAFEGEARLSQRLVALRTDEDVAFDLKALRYSAPTGEVASELRKIFVELEFGRLADLISAPPLTTRRRRAILLRDELDAFVAEVRAVCARDPLARLAVDTESTSHRPVDASLVGVSLCANPGDAVYIPIAHRYLGAPRQLSLDELRASLGPLLADPIIPKVGHDMKFDEEMLRLAGMPLAGVVFDTLLAHYLLDPEAPHGLKELAASELGVQMTTYDQVTRKDTIRRGQQLPFDEVPVEDATPYSAADADVSLELAHRFVPRLEAAGIGKLLREVELPVAEVLIDLELAGVLVDTARLQALSSEVEAQLRVIEEQARGVLRESFASGPPGADAGDPEQIVRDFNLASPKQLETILFDVLRLPVIKRTKTSRSTDADVLEELAERHPLPSVVLEHRSLAKLKGTYLDALPRMVSKKTGRLHTRYDLHVAATGRISSIDPNLQNIPIRTEVGRKIRDAFVAPPGFLLMSADYSQIELRVLADLSKDPILCDAFQRGEDVHARTARELFMAGEGEPTKEMRRRAKGVNFGVVYGQGEAALGKSLGIPRSEAATFISKYFERYAGVQRYMDEQIEIARQGHGVRTLLGRRRFLADIHSANRSLRMQAERIARNTPIQGSAADILKLAMIALREPPVPGARMLLTVHDELVFEVPEALVEEAARAVKERMEGVVRLAVPLVVDVGWGRTWADAHG